MMTLTKTDEGRFLVIDNDFVGDINVALPHGLPPEDFRDTDIPANEEGEFDAAMALHFVWLFLYSVETNNPKIAAAAAMGVARTLERTLERLQPTT
jgi:hypothetical protein